jgi:hypothetical protein
MGAPLSDVPFHQRLDAGGEPERRLVEPALQSVIKSATNKRRNLSKAERNLLTFSLNTKTAQ